MEQRDLVIIGGGPAGYIAAIRAKQLGCKVALIERDTLGGTCLNRGCIPTRTLTRGVEILDLSKKARDHGVSFGAAEIDFSKMMARKDATVRTVVGGVELLLSENGVEVMKGKGKLLSPNEVEVELGSGEATTLGARRIIIATGSKSKFTTSLDVERITASDQVLELDEIPSSMLIIGGGPIGLAFAGIFSRLGTKVTIIEGSTQILPGVDREIASLFERELRRQRIRLHTEANIVEIGEEVGTEREIQLSINGEQVFLNSQCVVAAEDREANIDGLGLEGVGVRVRVRGGRIVVNRRMETSVPSILAAGDVTEGPMLAHLAFAEGKVAAENAMAKGSEIDYSAVPMCTNTIPEIAWVGLTEDEAVAKGHQIRTGRFPFAANAMATILGERTGSVKIITEARYGQILGVHIIGPSATELISEAALAMKLDATSEEIVSTIHPHPTLSEALMEAALDATGEALHFLPPSG